jgi:hypothetical protein
MLSVLSYVADLLLAVLIFICFLFAARGLYYWGDALRMPGFVLFLRIIGLALLSFGAIWCIAVILNISISFKKLFLSQEGKLSRLRRLSKPVRESPILLFVCSVFITGGLYIGISSAEIGIVRDNCEDASILACEMICETGPNFPGPADNHVIMLKYYAKYMEQKHLPYILMALYGHDQEKALEATAQTLKSVEGGQEEIANDILRAGEDVMLSRLNAPKSFLGSINLYKRWKKAPKELLEDVNKAISQSKEAAKVFHETPTLDNAVESCEANRKTMLLLFLARDSVQSELFEDFQNTVKDSRDRKIEMAGVGPYDDPRKEFLALIAKSEQRRWDILEDLKKQNINSAIERIWEAVETAYRDRSAVLELCSKVRNTNSSEEITS